MLNYCFAVGRLGRDAEIKEANGKSFLSMAIAADSGFGEYKTTQWIEVSIWRNADKICKYLTKGKVVAVTGPIKISERNGKVYQSMTADNLTIIGNTEKANNRTGSAPKPTSKPKPEETPFDDDVMF